MFRLYFIDPDTRESEELGAFKTKEEAFAKAETLGAIVEREGSKFLHLDYIVLQDQSTYRHFRINS